VCGGLRQVIAIRESRAEQAAAPSREEELNCTMTLFIVVLPLRLTSAQLDLHRMLAEWLDDPQRQPAAAASESACEFESSEECHLDLQRLSTLRRTMANGLQDKDSYEQGVALLPTLHEYYACLIECENKGFPKWSSAVSDEDHDHDTGRAASSSSSHLQLEWESALSNDLQVYSNLTWERANLLWNLVTLEAYQASRQPQTTKIGWSKAAQHFQNAACLVQELQGLHIISNITMEEEANANQQHDHRHHHHHRPPEHESLVDFSRPFLGLWQALLVAQSQRCVYESLACAPRPRHLLLAKLAAAAVPLYNDCESLANANTDHHDAHANHGPSLSLQDHVPSLISNWSDYVRAYGIWMSSQAEFHQACLHKEKKQYGDELARLDLAFRFAHLACDFLESAEPLMALQSLHPIVDVRVQQLQQRLHDAQQENADMHKQTVPHRQQVPEIRGEKLVNVQQGLKDKFWMPLQEPMFTQVTASSLSSSPNPNNVRRYADLFVSEMDKLVFQMACVAEERTESARKALAVVNLPHSLTAYRQEQSGGGIPQDLWERVQAMQRDRRISLLQQDLWGLRDVAEQARTTYARIQSQLDFDLESDRLFRDQDNNHHHNNNNSNSPGGSYFEGHDAEEVQKTFRQSLANYDRLLVTAQEGDGVLLRRLEILDTNPKYKLLQFQKSQLDRLLPGANASSGPAIDTSHLSRLLVELSSLFHEREVLLNTIREEVKSFDIELTLTQQVDPRAVHADQEYRNALTYAQKSFDGIVYEMQNNIEQQTGLVDTILQENESFMHARENSPSSSSQQHTASADSCIVMIEDAMEEIEQLSKHLKEGKDFYDVVIPKLDKLKQQVGDVSARLTVERLEYDDNANRNRQEESDAMMARRMSNHNGGGGGGRSPSPDAAPRDAGEGGRSSEQHQQHHQQQHHQQQHQQHQHQQQHQGAHNTMSNSQHTRGSSQPGFAQIFHGEPQVRVDDEKVATLVTMEFDPAKVVAALAKYDNNMDEALNELLSG
jgi:programmed cell death 6-interacting protein